MVGSFYDPERDEGCAFEELISFHGGLGGARRGRSSCTAIACRCPNEPILGAAAVHGLLSSWRHTLQGEAPPLPDAQPNATTIDSPS